MQFHETRGGQKYYYGTIPKLVRGIERIANALEEHNKILSNTKPTEDKNCSKCKNRDKCAIYDNFNIDYCSDWN